VPVQELTGKHSLMFICFINVGAMHCAATGLRPESDPK